MIELVIVLFIVSLLAAAAVPSYQRYIARGNRAAAKAFLNDLAQRQSSFFADRKRFATSFAALGYTDAAIPPTGTLGTTVFIDEAGAPYSATSDDKRFYYKVTLVQNPSSTSGASSVRTCTGLTAVPDATSYRFAWAAKAEPRDTQTDKDKRCATLCLNGTGRQGASGTGTGANAETDGWQACWRG